MMSGIFLFLLGSLVASPPSAARAVRGPDLGTIVQQGDMNEPAATLYGSDRSSLPEAYPDGDWLSLDKSLLSTHLYTTVFVGKRSARALLDTGAGTTVMSRPVADKLGVLAYDVIRQSRLIDAHGEVLEGVKIRVPTITVGRRAFPNVEVSVVGNHPTLFLVGSDILEQIDLFVSPDDEMVGLFEPGRAPRPKNSREVSLERKQRVYRVEASARSDNHPGVTFQLIVDTGASQTGIPTRTGINGALRTDIHATQMTVALGGEREHRGRFLLNPLLLGPERVAVFHVIANPSLINKGEEIGLLGNDVLMRQPFIISFQRKKLWFLPPFSRPSFRTRGPAQKRCANFEGKPTRCIDAQIVHRAPDFATSNVVLPNRCIQVRVHPVYTSQTIEMAMSVFDEQHEDVLAGGMIHAFVTVGDNGFSGCLGLPHRFARLKFNDTSTLALRVVRTERIDWPCDPMDTNCLAFSGPYASLD